MTLPVFLSKDEILIREFYSQAHNLSLMIHGKEIRQDGSNVFSNHIKEVELISGFCVPHPNYHWQIRIAGLLHDVFEKLFSENITTLEERQLVDKFARQLVPDFGEFGKNICYVTNEVSSENSGTGLKELRTITSINRESQETIMKDVLATVLKNADNNSNNKPGEIAKDQDSYYSFIGKRIRKGLEYKYFSFPEYMKIFQEFKDLTINSTPLFDYNITTSIAANTKANVEKYLRNCNIQEAIIQNPGIGFLYGEESFYINALREFAKENPYLFTKPIGMLEEIMLKKAA